jgi:phosphoenolpyruvate-protein kinase (PTS system EI component)
VQGAREDDKGRASVTGSPVVEGIAIGRAVLWAGDPEPRRAVATVRQERGRIERAIVRAKTGLEELVRLLSRGEAELFEPEIAILAELEPLLLGRVDAGMAPEEAVDEAASGVATDLLTDVRARLLDALAHDHRSVESLLEGRGGDRVLVTASLTPSVVASLPTRVVGILAAVDEASTLSAGHASHAAILARGRDIPLVLVPPRVVADITDDEVVVLDATTCPARVEVEPGASTVAQTHARRDAWVHARAEEETKVTLPLAHLGVAVHVNVGSLYERIPASAEGIGLLRTELVFSDRTSAPGEAEHLGVVRLIAAQLPGAPVVVRLFDAGGDKPLPWLRPPPGSDTARGMELLSMHPALLDAQLRAVMCAADHADVRVMLPLVRCAADVEEIRARSHGKVPVGAMVETPSAVEQIDAIAAVSDFISIGTNDLFATVTGQARGDAPLALDPGALRMVERVISSAHARGRAVSVCGEIAADPRGACILVGLGVDTLSVATARFAKTKLALRDTTVDDCRAVAREALR